MSDFNAKAARAKRPCPIWIDAFQRDTQHLEADEIGAYFLLLMAMWTRESCDLPDDDMRLARVARVSLTLWKRRIGPVIREFFHAADGVVFQKRLREEATFVEHGVELQSSRKKGKFSDKPLKNIGPYESADRTTDTSADNPTQQPNNPTLSNGGGGSAGARDPENTSPDHPTFRERILEAMGAPGGVVGASKFIGGQGDVAEAMRWLDLPGITEDVAVRQVAETAAAKADGPARSFRYFTPAMQRLSSQMSAAPLRPDAAMARASPQPTRHLWKLGPEELEKFNDDGSRRQ